MSAYLEHKLHQIPNSYNLKRTNFEYQLDSIQTLILGSSHALNAINPAYLSTPTYNLANVSQSLDYDQLLTLKYLPQLPRLKTVIITLSYFSFYERLEDTDEAWRTYYYLHFWNLSTIYTDRGFDWRKHSLIALYTPSTTLKYAVQHFAVNEAPRLALNGYMRKDTNETYGDINDIAGLAKVKVHETTFHLQRQSEMLDSLSKFINLLVNHHIDVVLVTTPTYNTYSKFLDPTIVQQNLRMTDGLCQQFHIRYLNYANDLRFRLSDFANNDHLNDRGARKFSQIFEGDLRHL